MEDGRSLSEVETRMARIKRRPAKHTRQPDEETGFNWFGLVLLGAAFSFLLLLLYVLLSPVFFPSEPEVRVIPYGADASATPILPTAVVVPPTLTPAPTVPPPTAPPTEVAASAPTLPITAQTVGQLALQTDFGGLSAPVNSVAFSADGHLIAAGGMDGTVRVWQRSDGQLFSTFQSASNLVSSVAFSPDGLYLAAGGQDEFVRMWSLLDGAEEALSGPTAAVRSVAFSPGGEMLAAASDDGVVYVWRLEEGAAPVLVSLLGGHTSYVTDVAFSPNGEQIAAGGEDDTLRIWNVADGTLVATLTGHTGAVNALAFSPDGRNLASVSADHTVRLWDAQSGAELLTMPGHAATVNDVAFSPDGTVIVSAGAGIDGNALRFWSAQDGRELRVPLPLGGPAHSVAFSADGLVLAVGGAVYAQLWGIVGGVSPAPTPTAPRSATLPPTVGAEMTCTMTVRASEATLRGGPGEVYAALGALSAGQQVIAVGWTTAADGYTWWLLENGAWARGDAFLDATHPRVPDACYQLAPVTNIPPTPAATAAPTAAPAVDGEPCTLTVYLQQANRRAGPSTEYAIVGKLTQGQQVQALGWARDAEGYTWWLLADGGWARGDIFLDAARPVVPDACLGLPPATPSE